MKNNKFVSLVLVPGFIILILFSLIPLIYGLGISLFDYNPSNIKNQFIGFSFYRKLFKDPVFYKALKNTLVFTGIAVFLNLVITLFLASIISEIPSKIIKNIVRVIIFLPCAAPMVGTAMVWKYGFLETNGGLLNRFMSLINLSPQNWFISEKALMVIIIIFTLWADIGYNLILFTAAFEGVPDNVIEAGKLDGAGTLRIFFNIKLPLVSRVFAFVLVMTTIDYLQMFAQFSVFAPTGGQNNSVLVLTNYIYRTSFSKYNMGYASAISMALFLIIFLITIIQNKINQTDWSYE
ncbi:MAG: sugar ABC transporter permease [Finegoldia sp.]|nr:sugar ABC transporter permease [Finegoldia sp.]